MTWRSIYSRPHQWDVITTIAAAFGISSAMEQSGVAGVIATTLVNGGNSLGTGKPGVLIAVYIATFFLCNVVGNNAAAALMYPIAAASSEQQVEPSRYCSPRHPTYFSPS